VLQCVAVCCSAAVCCSMFQRVAVCFSVFQCVAMCCSVLQCVAVCCRRLCCVAVRGRQGACTIAVCGRECVAESVWQKVCDREGAGVRQLHLEELLRGCLVCHALSATLSATHCNHCTATCDTRHLGLEELLRRCLLCMSDCRCDMRKRLSRRTSACTSSSSHAAICFSILPPCHTLQHSTASSAASRPRGAVALSCSVLQCAAARCGVLQCVPQCCSASLPSSWRGISISSCVAVRCSVLLVLQCIGG